MEKKTLDENFMKLKFRKKRTLRDPFSFQVITEGILKTPNQL